MTSVWNSYLIKFYVQGLSEFWLSICYIAAGYFKLAYSCFKLADSCWFETWNSIQKKANIFSTFPIIHATPGNWQKSYLEISCTKQILDSLYLFYNALVWSKLGVLQGAAKNQNASRTPLSFSCLSFDLGLQFVGFWPTDSYSTSLWKVEYILIEMQKLKGVLGFLGPLWHLKATLLHIINWQMGGLEWSSFNGFRAKPKSRAPVVKELSI